eukprot:757774-Prorocentrum_minimum.AAC.6
MFEFGRPTSSSALAECRENAFPYLLSQNTRPRVASHNGLWLGMFDDGRVISQQWSKCSQQVLTLMHRILPKREQAAGASKRTGLDPLRTA